MPLEGSAQEAPMLSEHLRIAIAELFEQPRRALDVGEEERDRAAWKLPHGQMIRRFGRSG
jgi:hypothetical protein